MLNLAHVNKSIKIYAIKEAKQTNQCPLSSLSYTLVSNSESLLNLCSLRDFYRREMLRMVVVNGVVVAGCVTGRHTAMDTRQTTVACSAANRATAINFTGRTWRANTPYFRRKWRRRTAAPAAAVGRMRRVIGGLVAASRRTMRRPRVAVAGTRVAAGVWRPCRCRDPPTPSPTSRGPSTISRGRGDATTTTRTTTVTDTVPVRRDAADSRHRRSVEPSRQTRVDTS